MRFCFFSVYSQFERKGVCRSFPLFRSTKQNQGSERDMPYKPKSPCRQPGCPELTHEPYCEKHAPINRRESSSKRGYGSRWRVRSKLYLKANPLCVECNRKGKLTPATVVDHIKPHRGAPLLMWDETNWQALCKPCHDRKTGRQDSTPNYKY